jgi:hypothetical protein
MENESDEVKQIYTQKVDQIRINACKELNIDHASLWKEIYKAEDESVRIDKCKEYGISMKTTREGIFDIEEMEGDIEDYMSAKSVSNSGSDHDIYSDEEITDEDIV